MSKDLYRDSAERYQRDPEFHALVDMLFNFAVTQGYTPGELRQAAFYASLRAEQYALPPAVNLAGLSRQFDDIVRPKPEPAQP